MNELRIFCPATIANLSCGFDVMGLCLEAIGDEMVIRKSDKKGLQIVKVVGADLPFEIEKNVAGVAAQSLLDAFLIKQNKTVFELDFGFEIEIYKNIKAGSGIGSSAASAAGAVFGLNVLLGFPFTMHELVFFAMQGEVIASGSAHADNVAPCLFGGFTLVRSSNPLDVIEIPSPDLLFATVIHPHIELKTSEMRAVLPATVSLKNAITQWGNVGGLVAGLFKQDYELIGRSLTDVVIEPVRSVFIPEFQNLKQIAAANGGLGCGISGSGPSVFVLSKGKETADVIAKLFKNHFEKTTLTFDIYVSKIATMGCHIM